MTLRNPFGDLSLEETQQLVLTAAEGVLAELQAGIDVSDAASLAKLEAIRVLVDGTLEVNVANMIPAVETGLSKEVTLQLVLAKLNDVFSAVDGLEVSAESIAINADTINLSTDAVESLLQQIRDNAITAQAAQATAANQATEIAKLESIRLLLAGVLTVDDGHPDPLTNTELRAAPVVVDLVQTLVTDTFGNLLTGARHNQIEVHFDDTNWATYGTEELTGGAPAGVQSEGKVSFQSGAGANGHHRFTTTDAVKYRPLHGVYGAATAAFVVPPTSPGTIAYVWLLGEAATGNGVAIGYKGTSFGISYWRDGAEVSFTPRASWADPCSGGATDYTLNGAAATLDPAKGQVYLVECGLLGYAGFTVSVLSPDHNFVPVFTHIGLNTTTQPIFSNFDLYQYVDITKSSGGATNVTIHAACWAAGTTTNDQRLNDPLTDRSLAPTVRSVQWGKTTSGAYVPIGVDDDGHLLVTAFVEDSAGLAKLEEIRAEVESVFGTQPGTTNDLTNTPTAAMTTSAPVVFTADNTTDVLTSVGHGLVNGDSVLLSSDDTLPAGLVGITPTTPLNPEVVPPATSPVNNQREYIARNVTADTFQLSSSLTGSITNFTTDGVGVHTWQKPSIYLGSTWADVEFLGGVIFLWANQPYTQRPAAVQLEWSNDGVTPLATRSTLSVREVVSGVSNFNVYLSILSSYQAKYVRVRVVSGINSMTTPPLAIFYKTRFPFQGTFGFLDSSLTFFSQALLTRSVLAAVDEDGNIGNVIGDRDHHIQVSASQFTDTDNSIVITDASTEGAAPGDPWVGVPFATRSRNIQENLTTAVAVDALGDYLADLGGTLTFRYYEDVAGVPTVRITEPLVIRSFSTVRATGWLSNAGDYYSVEFEPDRPLVAGETVIISTTHSKLAGNDFKRLPAQVLEEENQPLTTVQAFLKGFTVDGDSENFRAIPAGETVDEDTLMLAVKSVAAGIDFEGDYIDAGVPEHTIDVPNSLAANIANGAITPFTVDDVANTIESVGHGLVQGDAVVLTTDGTLPAPLDNETGLGTETSPILEVVYWVINPTADDFQLTTNINAAVPTAVNITDAGTGTHNYQKRGQFVGAFKDYSQIGHGLDFFLDLQRPAVLRSEWSDDGIAIASGVTALFATSARALTVASSPGFGDFYINLSVVQTMIAKYRRVRYVNGPGASLPGLFSLTTFIGKANYPGSFGSLQAALSNLSTALLVRSVQSGFNPDGGFENISKQGRHSANSTVIPLNGDTGGTDHIFIGEWFQWQNSHVGAVIDAIADVPGTLLIEFSEAAAPAEMVDTDVDDFIQVDYDPAETSLLRRPLGVQSRWIRCKWVNGLAAQAEFSLDTAFLTSTQVVGQQPLNLLPRPTNLASMTHSVMTVEAEDGESFVHPRVSENADTGKSGLNQHLTGIDFEMPIRPVEDFEPGVLIVGVGAPVPIPDPPAGLEAKSLALTNTDPDIDVWFGKSDVQAGVKGHAILARTGFDVELKGAVQGYLIAGDTGVPTLTSDRFGASVANNVGVTNPTNILTQNDARATFDALTDSLDVTGFTMPQALDQISTVKLKLEARRATTPTVQLVDYVDVVTGTAGNVGSVASGTVTANAQHFYLAAISRKNAAAAVSGVSGMGATWVQVGDVSGDSGDTRISVWRNTTAPTTSGAVTATFSQVATNAVIGVYRYSDVDLADPIEASETLNSGSATSSYSDSIVGTDRGMLATFVSMRQRVHTPGSGATEQNETHFGGGINDASLAGNTLQLLASGVQAYSGTFDATVGWSVVAVTLNPAAVPAPMVRVRYQVGSDPIGASVLTASLTETNDVEFEVNVTGDRVWQYSNVANTKLIVTVDSIGDAAAEIDAAWLEVIESDTGADAIVTYLWVGDIIA